MSWLRPSYGTYFKVTPKRWWSRKDRKSARMTARYCDYMAPTIQRKAIHMAMHHSIHQDDRWPWIRQG